MNECAKYISSPEDSIGIRRLSQKSDENSGKEQIPLFLDWLLFRFLLVDNYLLTQQTRWGKKFKLIG